MLTIIVSVPPMMSCRSVCPRKSSCAVAEAPKRRKTTLPVTAVEVRCRDCPMKLGATAEYRPQIAKPRSEERRVGTEGGARSAARADKTNTRRRVAPSGRGASVTFFFSSRRRHTRSKRDWSSDVCSSDLVCPRKSSCAVAEAPKRRKTTLPVTAVEVRCRDCPMKLGATAEYRPQIAKPVTAPGEAAKKMLLDSGGIPGSCRQIGRAHV